MPAAMPAVIAAFQYAAASVASTFGAATLGASLTSAAAATLGAAGITGIAATAIAVGGSLAGIGTIAGVSALLQPDVPKVGAQIQAKAGSVIPRTMVMGRTAIAGVLANDTFYSGRDNGVATQFYILSGAGDCGTIEKILIGDDEVTFNSPVNNIYRAVGKYSGALWMCQKSGSWTQAAINFNSGGNGLKSGEHPSEWTTNHRLLGCMNMCLMIGRYNEPIKSNGLNGTVLSIVKAENVGLIDPRTGSAATTWAQKQNPWVWAYSYLKNITSSVSPTGVVLAGCNMPDSGIDATSFAYAANIADANSWTIAGEVVLESGKKNEILSGMCQAGGGSYTFRNGKVYATVAGIKAVAGYLTNDHIREDISVAPLSPAQTVPNRIIPRFISESNSWKVIDGSVITDASFVTQDGAERTINYEIPYCGNGAAQAAKLAALALVNSREPFQFDVPLMPSGRYLALPGDCLQITADLTDWVGQKILVNKLTGNGDLTANIHATSETDSKYAWALGQTTVPPDYTASVLIDKSYVATPTGTAWTVIGTQITQGDNIVPCIRVAGSASEYAGCGGIVVEYKPAAGSTWFSAGDLVYTSSGIEITSVTPNTSYNVRIAYYNKYGVRGTFYTPTAVTTGDLQAGMAASADIANGIVNQSPIAAGNNIAASDIINSDNRLYFTDFEANLNGWHLYSGSATLTRFVSSGKTKIGATLNATKSGQTLAYTQDNPYTFSVNAGERLAVQCKFDCTGTAVAYSYLEIAWIDSAGNTISYSLVDSKTGISGTGSKFNGFVIAPINAVKARLNILAGSNGAGTVTLNMYEPMVSTATANQTAFPAYSKGINAYNAADITIDNTAIAIVNQGGLATQNTVGTNLIDSNAVTNSVSTATSSNVSISPSTSWSTIQTQTITSNGGSLDIDVALSLTMTTDSVHGSASADLRVLVDGTAILTESNIASVDPKYGLTTAETVAQLRSLLTTFITNTPAAGSRTITLQARILGGSGGEANGRIRITERKR